MIIRLFEVDDADAIAKLWEELVLYHHQLDPAMPKAVIGGSEQYVQRILQQYHHPHQRVWVAEDNAQVVGYILVLIIDLMPEMFEQERAGFIADIMVRPAWRHQGIGRKLVEAARQWFREQEVSHFEWTVASNNPSAIAFWHAVGGRDVMIRMRAEV